MRACRNVRQSPRPHVRAGDTGIRLPRRASSRTRWVQGRPLRSRAGPGSAKGECGSGRGLCARTETPAGANACGSRPCRNKTGQASKGAVVVLLPLACGTTESADHIHDPQGYGIDAVLPASRWTNAGLVMTAGTSAMNMPRSRTGPQSFGFGCRFAVDFIKR